MAGEYNLEESLPLPGSIFERELDGYHVILATQNPNWLVLRQEEYRMFQWLQEGLSIRLALENYYTWYCQDEGTCLDIMKRLLEQVDETNFSSEAAIMPEEPVETIVKKVHIGTTNACNMHCSHCYMAAGTMPLETIELQNTIRLISELNHIYGRLEIVVSGGEPLTYKDIETLLAAIKNNDIILFTNGSLITEKNIDLIAECCDEVQISFEGVSEEYYSAVRGENFGQVIHAIELLKMRNVRIVLAVTILPSTLPDIRDNLIPFVNSLNYNNLEVRLSDEIEMAGNALSMDLSSYDEKETRKIYIDLICKLESLGCVVQKSEARNIRYTNCGIGTNILINYDGKIYPCHKLSDYAFDARTDVRTIVTEFNKVNAETSNDNILKCHTCELRYICSGGCRIDNYLKTGDMNHVICDEKYKDRQYKRLIDNFKMYWERIDTDE